MALAFFEDSFNRFASPCRSWTRAALWGAGVAFLLVLLLLAIEALTFLGTLNPVHAGFLQRYADIPHSVVEELGRRVASGILKVYLAVATYFAVGCSLVVFSWRRGGQVPSPKQVSLLVLALFSWVMTSGALKLLAVHPYAAEGIPWLTGIERLTRNFWDPIWALSGTVLLALLLTAVFSRGETLWVHVRRGTLLCCFIPLLGPTVSSLKVTPPSGVEKVGRFSAPPVIVIGIDSLRADHVSRWGGPAGLTPHLDEFLAESYEFTNAWTVVGRTHPSYVSMLTGRTPDRHGVRYNRADPFFAGKIPKTIGHALVEAGYSTRYLTDDNMFSLLGPEHGFQTVNQPPTTLETYASRPVMSFFFLSSLPARWTSKVLPALSHNRAIHSNYDSQDFSDAVGGALDEELGKKKPFFLVAHLCTGHFPGSQPGPEFRAYQPADTPAIDYFKATLTQLKDGEMHVDEARDVRLRGLYKAGVKRTDAELGRILMRLRTQGILDQAWVVVWSDHGEAFLDSKGKPILPSHGLAVDEGGEDLRIVMGIRPPKGRHARVESAVSSVDIVPTLLTGLRLPPLPGEREGRVLQDLIDGQKVEEPILYAETGVHYGRNLDEGAARYNFDLLRLYRFDPQTGELVTRRHFHDQLLINKQRMVQKGEFRLVYEPRVKGEPRRRLFRWARGERPASDVQADHPLVFTELNAALDAHLTDLEPDKLALGVKKDEIKSSKHPWLFGLQQISAKVPKRATPK